MTERAITLDADLLEQVRLWASREDRAVQDVIREALEAYLKKAYESLDLSVGDQQLDADLIAQLHDGRILVVETKTGDEVAFSLIHDDDGSEHVRVSSDRFPFIGSLGEHATHDVYTNEEPYRIVDLMEALRASIERAHEESSTSGKQAKRKKKERLEDAG